MTYEHVTSLPFLLDSSHLTPEEVAERDKNPALFAARRYGQPEYIFRTAAERHENGTLKPSFLAAHRQSSGSYNPAQAVSTVVPSAGMHSSQEFQSRQSSRSPAATPSFSPSPYSSATSSPRGSTTSGHYFSTVLSHASGEQSASSPTSSSIAHAGSDQAHHSRQGAQRQTALERDKKKGQKHEK